MKLNQITNQSYQIFCLTTLYIIIAYSGSQLEYEYTYHGEVNVRSKGCKNIKCNKINNNSENFRGQDLC